MAYPASVKLVEVGPRDGLQNEATPIDTLVKVEFINRLSETGLSVIEATSMVSPKWVPQLADAERVYAQITKHPNVTYPILVPNVQGFKRAQSVSAQEVAVFATVSETFSQKNTHCTIEESLGRIQAVVNQAKSEQIPVRAYLSCVLGCPYEGTVDVGRVAMLAKELYDIGCYEISLGDTIGLGTPLQAKELIEQVSNYIPIEHIAVHFHDTRGQALANILACLESGVSIVDASVAGLGGCPYAKGASGNVATEDVVYMLHGMGIETGIDLDKLISVGQFISDALGRESQSKVGRAAR